VVVVSGGVEVGYRAPSMWKLVFLALLGVAIVLFACNTAFYPSTTGCSGDKTCTNGAGTLQTCYTLDTSGACSSLYYEVGSTVYNCVSCDDQGYCANAALIACGVPDASIPADADLPEGAILFFDSGAPPAEAGAPDAARD
jgi:hypothetical protein